MEERAETNAKSPTACYEISSGFLTGVITGFGNIFSGTETGFNPCVPGFKDILQGLLWGISLTGAMLEIRDISHKTRILFAPENIDMVMRDVHEWLG